MKHPHQVSAFLAVAAAILFAPPADAAAFTPQPAPEALARHCGTGHICFWDHAGYTGRKWEVGPYTGQTCRRTPFPYYSVYNHTNQGQSLLNGCPNPTTGVPLKPGYSASGYRHDGFAHT
ncbi:peptidase inhibitor family I36 protein [Amycolatopsis sp. NPDC089917]|uniref:peptidase inhibitor family I36 protein n=1 Tax=Amycolatopsis sp. NPDC089917 TaxID=3155187 RepID=UPI0034270299